MAQGQEVPDLGQPQGLLLRTASLLDRQAGLLQDAARTLRFLQGRLAFFPRPDDVFISSYPRSGTTWLQLILYLLTTDGSMDFDHISQKVPWFERALAVGSLTGEEIEHMPSPRVFKSHLPYHWLPRGGRCIYVLREGRDVALSYYHFYCSHLGFRGGLEEFFERFLGGDLQYGSWFKHVAGWLAHQDNPRVLVVRYEELQASFVQVVAGIMRFCGIPGGEKRAQEAQPRCTFQLMKENEERFDFITEHLLEKGYQRLAFLRGGQVGQGADQLTREQQVRFSRESQRARVLPDLELDLPRFLH